MTPCNHKFIDSTSCLKCGWTPDVENPLLPLIVQAHIDVEKLKADLADCKAAYVEAHDKLARLLGRCPECGRVLTPKQQETGIHWCNPETKHGLDGPDTNNGPQNQA